jgi:transposase
MKTKHARLRVLKLAERLNNVAEACRRCGVNRASFYEWRKRYLTSGSDGLVKRTAAGRTSTHKVSPELVESVKATSLQHPAFGCDRIAPLVSEHGMRISSVTAQKILNDLGLGTRRERWLALEDCFRHGARELSAEQIAFIEQHNPVFRDRAQDCGELGDLMHADTIVASSKGLGRVYLHAIIDGCSGVAFGALALTNDPEIAIGLLDTDVLPILLAFQIQIKAILTGWGREFSGPGRHPYQRYLSDHHIAQKMMTGSYRHTGRMERFRQTFLTSFIQQTRASSVNPDLAALQADFAVWIKSYNVSQRQDGFRNYGKTPAEVARITV